MAAKLKYAIVNRFRLNPRAPIGCYPAIPALCLSHYWSDSVFVAPLIFTGHYTGI